MWADRGWHADSSSQHKYTFYTHAGERLADFVAYLEEELDSRCASFNLLLGGQVVWSSKWGRGGGQRNADPAEQQHMEMTMASAQITANTTLNMLVRPDPLWPQPGCIGPCGVGPIPFEVHDGPHPRWIHVLRWCGLSSRKLWVGV